MNSLQDFKFGCVDFRLTYPVTDQDDAVVEFLQSFQIFVCEVRISLFKGIIDLVFPESFTGRVIPEDFLSFFKFYTIWRSNKKNFT